MAMPSEDRRKSMDFTALTARRNSRAVKLCTVLKVARVSTALTATSH